MHRQQVKMTKEDIHIAKSLICQGHSQVAVARAVGISASHMSRICAGDVHRDIPWPDPSVGEKLMRDRREVISYTPLRDSRPDLASLSLPPVIRHNTAEISTGEIRDTQQATEGEAIEEARTKAAFRAELRRQVFERAEKVEDEMNKEFLKNITTVREGQREGKEGKKPTAWDAKFIAWEEVIERAEKNMIVEVLKDNEDEILQRAIGIVFFAIPQDEWEGEQAVQMIASVVGQLKVSQKEPK